jgi:hypothetical protein
MEVSKSGLLVVDVVLVVGGYGALWFVGSGQLGIFGVQGRYGTVSALRLFALCCIYGGFAANLFRSDKRRCLCLCVGALVYLGHLALMEWQAAMLLPLAAYSIGALWTVLAWLDDRRASWRATR